MSAFTEAGCCSKTSRYNRTNASKKKRYVDLAAIDGTGFESRHVSQYFLRRTGRLHGGITTSHCKAYPKMGLICNCSSHIILAVFTGRGPGSDMRQMIPTLHNLVPSVKIKTLLADAGYDSEANHKYVREELKITTVIPPTSGNRGKNGPSGHYRKMMHQLFSDKPKQYTKRWQVESTVSMIKRNLGAALKARNFITQSNELWMLALTRNIAVVWLHYLFYRAPRRTYTPIYATWKIPHLLQKRAEHLALSS